MSAAVMSTSAVYDFGDTLLKSHNGSSAVRHQQHVRWGDFHQRGEREGLSRRASNPAAPLSTLAPMASMAPLAPLPALNTLVIQLDSQQQQQPQQQPPQSPAQPAHRKLDRSHSEPANPVCSKASAAGAAAAATSAVNTSRYKTELCRPFEESGSCKYGDKCQFAHGAHELRTLVRHPKYKTELCRTYHTIGLCPYGPRCHFVHNDEESLAHPGMPGPGQHAKPAVPAHAAHAATALPRPKALSLATPLAAPHSPAHSYLGGSTADSPSPTSSLSQSPTNSHRSFFMSSEDVFGSVSPTPTANTAFSFGQDFATLVQPSGPGVAGHHIPCGSTGSVGSVGSASSRDSPSPPGSPFRLPIFNTLSNTLCNQVKMIHL